jgi:hypothetical protein
MTNVSEELTASIIRVMVNTYQTTRCNIPEDSHLQSLHRFVSNVYDFKSECWLPNTTEIN